MSLSVSVSCFSVLSVKVASSVGVLSSCSSCCLLRSFMAATLAAAIACSSALLLRPLCLGCAGCSVCVFVSAVSVEVSVGVATLAGVLSVTWAVSSVLSLASW